MPYVRLSYVLCPGGYYFNPLILKFYKMVKQTLKNLAALAAKKILTCVLPFCER